MLLFRAKKVFERSGKRGGWYAWTQCVINLSSGWRGIPFAAVVDYRFITELWVFLSKIRGRLGEAPLEAECER